MVRILMMSTYLAAPNAQNAEIRTLGPGTDLDLEPRQANPGLLNPTIAS